MKTELKNIYNAITLFNRRKGTTLSSSCTFYFLLTLIPSLLVVIHLLSFFLGDLASSSDYVFSILQRFFPNIAPDFLQNIQKISWKLLFQKNKLSFFNFFLLVVSSLSFFNSVWNGLFLLSGNKKHNSHLRYLKGIGIISLTIFFLVLMVILQPILGIIVHYLQDNLIYNYLWDSLETLRPLLIYLKELNNNFVQLIMFLFFLIYFTFFYKIILQEKIPVKIAFRSTLIFSIPFVVGRFAFLFYIDFAKQSMIQNYGSFYYLVLALLWIYLLLSFFYLGAAYSLATLETKNKQNANFKS